MLPGLIVNGTSLNFSCHRTRHDYLIYLVEDQILTTNSGQHNQR
jgi:hypothetical protein